MPQPTLGPWATEAVNRGGKWWGAGGGVSFVMCWTLPNLRRRRRERYAANNSWIRKLELGQDS